MEPTVYIETSVISYHTSRPSRDLIVAAHQQITAEWWDTVLPQCAPRISGYVIEEIKQGDPDAAERRVRAIARFALLDTTPGVVGLAESYMVQTDLPDAAKIDAFHLALASWHGLDYMVSWNLKHIVNLRMRAAVRQINEQQGLDSPQIGTPEELMEL